LGSWVEEAIDATITAITRFLSWSFRHAKTCVGLVFLLFAGSIYLIPAGFSELNLPRRDRSEFIMELELDQNATCRIQPGCKQVEDILKSYRDVEKVYTNVGLTSSGRIISMHNIV